MTAPVLPQVRAFTYLFSAPLMAVLLSSSALSDIIIDDMGREVDLTLPIERAVIFNRYGVEFARAIGGIDQVVGIDASTYRDPPYWPQFSADDIVGEGQRAPNYEAIVAKSPDVVILPRNGAWEEAIAQLEPFGIPVVVLTAWDAEKHEENVTLMGEILGHPEGAEALNAYYAGWRDLLAERLDGVEPVSVYLEETRPLVTVTPGSGWHDMILQGGGSNIFGEVDIENEPASRGNVNAFTIDPEELVIRAPELVIKLMPGSYESIGDDAFSTTYAELSGRHEVEATPAGRDGAIYLINYYLAGGSSKITGALQVAKWAHPERFSDIDPEEAMRVWIEDFQGLPYQGGMVWPAANAD